MNRLARIQASFRRATVCRRDSRWPRTSSPPSVVTSARFSGTNVAEFGARRHAIPVISSVAAISRLIRVVTTSFSTSRSRSWMCRRSSRRWTVIPSAPESSAIAAAAAGSGTCPRRAWRSVATWSMFTPRRFPTASTPLFPRLLRQGLHDRLDLLPVLPFHHDPQERLRAAVPDHDPPPAPQHLLELALRLPEPLHRIQRDALLHPDVLEDLRERHQPLPHLGRLLPGLDHHGEELQGGQHPVPRGRVIEEDQVAGLLPAEIVSPLAHHLDHVPVPDRRPDQPDLPLLEIQLQADVAHHGGDQGALGELLLPRQLLRAHRHDPVAVEHLSLLVHDDHPVGVAV